MWVFAVRNDAALFQLTGDRTDPPRGDVVVKPVDFRGKNR
jgi:hypothetical protein